MAKKEKQEFFEEMEFDNVSYAQDMKEECERKLQKISLGLKIAAVSTVFSVLMLFPFNSNVTDIFMLLAIVGAIVSYIIGGGLGTALKAAWKICVVGWFIIPIFPVDLALAMFAFIVACCAFFFAPILFVWINNHQVKKDYQAALKYLSYYKPVGQPDVISDAIEVENTSDQSIEEKEA